MRTKILTTTFVAFVLSVAGASAAPLITVYTSLAPNAFGSPSFPSWETNAVTAMQNNGATTGAGPSQFQTVSNVTSAQAIVTGFPSWMGLADPATNFGAAYANELGNRMTFSVHIDGNGNQFSIGQMGFNGDSTDPFNALDWSNAPGVYNYGTGYWGLQYVDGIKGNGNDVWVMGGANNQMVDELFGRGSGNSFAAYCPGCTVAQQQAAIDASAAYPGTPFQLTGTYYLMGGNGRMGEGSATFNINPSVPEPTTLVLFVLGLVGIAKSKRRLKG